jgi:hypothetical protein
MPTKKEAASKDSSICANCGIAAEDWSEPYKLGSQTYCCQGCAEQTGCTCDVDKRATA